MFYLQYFIDTLQSLSSKKNNYKQNVLLLGDGFFARGFLHTIDYNNYHITQIYRDEFINPQDIFYSLHRDEQFQITKQIHFRDKIHNFFNKKNITKIKTDINTLQISTNNAIINNKSYCFDYMVIGLGAQKSLKNWADELNYLIKQKNKQIDIIGTGPVGFEISMMLNKFNKINMYDVLSEDKIFPYISNYHKKFILNLLDKKNITLNLGEFYNPNDIQNKDNYKIFCIGTKSNELTNNMLINNKLLLNDYTNVYIGGDCINSQYNQQYIKNAQVAYQQGVYVARRLNREINNNKINNNEINNNDIFEYKSNGIALNIDDSDVLIENHNIIPNGIYPDFIIKLYSIFCI